VTSYALSHAASDPVEGSPYACRIGTTGRPGFEGRLANALERDSLAPGHILPCPKGLAARAQVLQGILDLKNKPSSPLIRKISCFKPHERLAKHLDLLLAPSCLRSQLFFRFLTQLFCNK